MSAWASEQSLVLAQQTTRDDPNEITAIPGVLRSLVLEGALVTLDAMVTQKDIAQHIRDQEADYLLTLKANRPGTYDAVQTYFEHWCFGPGALQRGARSRLLFDSFDEGHGRLVRRRVFAQEEAARLKALSEWPDVQTVLATENIGSVNGQSGVSAQIRYFLSSRPIDDQQLVKAIRRHLSIENRLHWVLDVTFNEDQSRVRERPAASNWTILGQIALNLLNGDTESRASIRGRRKRAGWDNAYMEQLVHSNLMR